jgi:hypothetical protein
VQCLRTFHIHCQNPPSPRPTHLPAHHNRYQNTSLLLTATFTTVSSPTPTHMIYCPRGSAASLKLQYLSRIHVLGARSQSGGTEQRTYFSHCAWIGQQKFFTSTCRVLPSINWIKTNLHGIFNSRTTLRRSQSCP